MRELTAEEQYRDEIKELQDRLHSIRLETIEECRLAVGVHIKHGPLQGNGCDDTAQRNGMILAQNILYGLANAPVVEKHEPITFDGNVADVPRYPTGPKVRGPE